MQAEIPLPAEAHECVGRLVELVVPSLGDGVPEEKGRDRRRWAIDGMRGIARDVEEKLGIDVGDVHAEVGSEGLASDRGPLAERVVSHPPILLQRGT